MHGKTSKKNLLKNTKSPRPVGLWSVDRRLVVEFRYFWATTYHLSRTYSAIQLSYTGAKFRNGLPLKQVSDLVPRK